MRTLTDLARNGAVLSHDNVSHTLLGLFDIDTVIYEKDLDILAMKN